MSIDVRWAGAGQTVIIASLPPAWEVEDFEHARCRIIRMALSVEHPIAVILDGTGTRLPASFISYATALTRKGPRPAQNIGLYVIVTPNRLVQSMYHAFLRVQGAGVFANRLTLVNTLEEALALIETEHRQTT